MKNKHVISLVSILFLIAVGLKLSVYNGVFDLEDQDILTQSSNFLKQQAEAVYPLSTPRKSVQELDSNILDQRSSKAYTTYILQNNTAKLWSRADVLPTDIDKLLLTSSGYFKNKNALYTYYWTPPDSTYKILLTQKIAETKEKDPLPFIIHRSGSLHVKTIQGEHVNLRPRRTTRAPIAATPNIIFILALTLLLFAIPRLFRRQKRTSVHPVHFSLFYTFLVLASTVFFNIPTASPTFWVISLTTIFSSLAFSLYHFKFKINSAKIASSVYTFILYLIILIVLLLIYYVTFKLVNTQILNINYSRHFLFHQQLIGQLSILIILALASSLICNKIMVLIRSYKIPFRRRVIPILLALSAISILFILFFQTPNYLLFLSLSAIALMLLDLYQDRPSLNFTWLFTWVVIISAFLAINLTVHHVDSSLNEVKKTIQDKLMNTDESDITRWIHKASEGNNALSELLSPPYPFEVQPQHAIDELIKNIPDEISKDYVFEAYTFDNRGACISQNNSPYSKEYIEHVIYKESEDVKIIDHAGQLQYIYTLKEEAKNHPYGPLLTTLLLTPKNQSNEDLYEGQIITYNEGIPIYDLQNIDAILDSNQKKSIQSDQRPNYNLYEINSNFNTEIFFLGKKINLIKPLSLFSLLITLAFIILLISTIINTYIKILPDQLKLFISKRKSLRYKIQLTVLSSIIGSFMIIAFITLIYLRNSYQHTHLQKVETLIESFLHKYQLSNVLDQVKIDDADMLADLADFSKIHDCKLELFGINGDRLDSSSDQIKAKINPIALNALLNKDRNLAILSNSNSTFFDDRGKIAYLKIEDQEITKGILKIAAADSESSLSQGLSDFLSTLLNVYVFLFLIAGTVAIALANSITKPIAVLGENLKNLKLGKRQEPLKWENQDELGDLIKDYNLTVNKLEESAKLLAITERESAWREMAKQVAHEIKNPLTPMKLSIQHLKMASGRAENPQIKTMIERVSVTLLEQIEALSDIASEFSNFAHFPKPENQTTILNEVIATAHDLFRKRDDMQINLYVPIDEIYVFADKNYLLRVFNNLLKNAIQAIPNDRSGKIDIRLFKKNGLALVEIEDNGMGIPKEMYDKVFTPNFTTKNSGTGLGLAISSNIIESFNGRIYFNTKLNRGTIFYVEIPLMRKEDNFKISKRVALD